MSRARRRAVGGAGVALARLAGAIGIPTVSGAHGRRRRCGPPSPVSPTDSPMFVAIATALRQVRPDAVAAPYLVVGRTDARYYTKLTPNVYRFTPFALGREDVDRLHGTDERIQMHDYVRGVRFYTELVRGMAR
ncbi:MAG TPA: M20/M25/M40 family metallo-hydrolase [Gemmatimonadales bacterium]|nr:M20/M25/M40 family metallo-hydrolase [Gemmatimonadales bacterium]